MMNRPESGADFSSAVDLSPGMPGVAREQHLLLFSIVWALDRS